MSENPNAVDITPGGFRSLLGMEPTKNADPTKQPDDVSYLNRFTNSESQALAKTTYIPPANTKSPDFSAAGIISYLKPIHQKVGENILDARKMGALAPEIEQSKILVSSSIMSPNDLQDGFFTFNFDSIPALASDPELANKVQELYNQHFNGNLELGIKSYDWIGECQYESGSKALLILPIATFLDYKHRTLEEINARRKNLLQPAMSSFEEYTKVLESKYGKSIWSDDTSFKFTESTIDTLRHVAPALESFNVLLPKELRSDPRATDNDYMLDNEYIQGLESVVVNLKKTIEEGDAIHITDNPEIVKFNVDKKMFDRKNTRESLKKFFNQQIKENYPIEEVGVLKSDPKKFEHVSHPVLIELPSESVIPLCIPGAPHQHLGYFILLDQYGQPLTIENSGLARNQNSIECGNGSPNSAYTALYGSGCSSSYFQKNPNMMNNIGNTVFQYLLDQYFRARLTNVLGRSDLTLERFNAISTLMFQRLLEQKKTTVLYVPPTLLHYFAFAYNKDGTGVSKLEDIKFLLSLRTTLLMAQIIAMVNDAIDHKKIELTVDEKTANLEALMELVGNIFIEKNRLSGNIDPSEIVRDIYSNSLTIVPKNIPGLGNFDVDVSTISSQSTRPDDALLEQLNNLLVSKLDVPPSALNQLSEPEFSRSIVTYNLFFAKKVTRYQRIWCKQIEEFIKDYTYFDIVFQKALKKILEAHSKHTVSEKLPDKVKQMKDKNPNQRSANTNEKIIQMIMDGVKVSLPKPDIVVDKTQFEEIRNYSSNVNEMADMIYPNELIPSENQEATNGLAYIKAMWKRSQMMDFIANIGCFKMFDVKDIDDFNSDDLVNLIQTCMNLGMHVKKHQEALTAEGDQGFGGEGGYGDEGGGGFGEEEGGFGEEETGGEEGGEGGEDMGDFGMEEEPAESQENSGEVTPREEEPESPATMLLKMHRNSK